MNTERAQNILSYPLKPENPANLLYAYKPDDTDNVLNDRIISSKPMFKYEDKQMTKEEQRIRKFNELTMAQTTKFKSYLQQLDPMDKDFNYSKIEKLSHEYMYEYIEQQIQKAQNISQVLQVFQKKNERINFFLCDYDGIIDNIEVDITKRKQNGITGSKPEQIIENPESGTKQHQQVMAQESTHSQGGAFFYVEKSYSYEYVSAFPDGVYIEIRNKDNPDQIGIFKKKDFSPPFSLNPELSKQQNTSASGNNLNIFSDNKNKESTITEADDHSDISNRSKKYSITGPGSSQNIRKKSYSIQKKNILSSPSTNTPMKNSQNLSTSYKYSAQQSTAASRRY